MTDSYPGTLRILLSGGADAASLEAAQAVTDHMLQKPCNAPCAR